MAFGSVNKFLILFLLALLTGGAWCGTPRCMQCGRVIAGSSDNIKQRSSYTINGRTFCPACYNKALPRCKVCHKALTKYYPLSDNTVICGSCYKKRRRGKVQRNGAYGPLVCSVCQQNIRGKYYEPDKQKVVCESCYEAQRPICVCCGKKIMGSQYTYGDGVKACEDCVKDTRNPRCEECNVPINHLSARPVPHYDRYACERHRQSVVANYTAALGLMQIVRRQMVSALGAEMVIRGPVELKLVNKRDLYKAYGKTSGSEFVGFCHTEDSGASMTHIIYIEGGRSRADIYVTLAHELAHAWQHENNTALLRVAGTGGGKNRFVEGFAEWAAYRTTEAFGDKRKLQAMLNKKNDAYSQGLRDFLQYEKQHGKRAVLEAAKTRTSL